MVHLILISTNGTVWDVSLNENISPSRKKTFKLPDSCLYHGYSDDAGVVYFVNGDLQKRIIKYHQSFSRNVQITGNKAYFKGKNIFPVKHDGFFSSNGNGFLSLDYDTFCYTQSLLFGNYFWLFGKWHKSFFDQDGFLSNNIPGKLRSLCKYLAVSESYTSYIAAMEHESVIQYPRRQILNHGPNLPDNFYWDDLLYSLCSVSLNRTHLMIIGHVSLENSINYGVSIIDFPNQRWFPCPSMNVNYMTHSKGALGFLKNGNR